MSSTGQPPIPAASDLATRADRLAADLADISRRGRGWQEERRHQAFRERLERGLAEVEAADHEALVALVRARLALPASPGLGPEEAPLDVLLRFLRTVDGLTAALAESMLGLRTAPAPLGGPGGAPTAAELAEQTQAIQRSLAVWMAALHRAPARWFADLWRRLDPARIEERVRASRWDGRAPAAACWQEYRAQAERLDADLAREQMLDEAARWVSCEMGRGRARRPGNGGR
jgi:hypothetical protein